MRNKNYDRLLYQAYVDAISYLKDAGRVNWVPLKKIISTPHPLNFCDATSTRYTNKYFDMAISLLKENSHWLFLLHPNNNILEGKHRIEALLLLESLNLIGANTSVLAGTMQDEDKDQQCWVFLPVDIPDSYYELSALNKLYPIKFTKDAVVDVNHSKYYLMPIRSLYHFMRFYNYILRDAFVNTSLFKREYSLQSIKFQLKQEVMPTIRRTQALYKDIQKNYKETKFWDNPDIDSVLLLYKNYYRLLKRIQYDTEKSGSFWLKKVRLIDLHPFQGEKPKDFWANYPANQLKREINKLKKNNFPFMIFVEAQNILPISQRVFDLIHWGIKFGMIDRNIEIMVHSINDNKASYHISGKVPAPDVISTREYLDNYPVYQKKYERALVDGLPLVYLSHYIYYLAFAYYEQVCWDFIDDISTLPNKFKMIMWS